MSIISHFPSKHLVKEATKQILLKKMPKSQSQSRNRENQLTYLSLKSSSMQSQQTKFITKLKERFKKW